MIYFLDFEASSLLPGSFPIEVAWMNQDGVGESHLIRPTERWLAGGCPGWSPESEQVHGLPLELLLAEGSPVEHVAARAAAVLSAEGATVYSDAPDYDGNWLQTLLATGSRAESVRVHDVQEAFSTACQPLLASIAHTSDFRRERMQEHVRALARAIVSRAVEAEAIRPRTRHRALPDAESLWRTWRVVRHEVSRTLAERGAPRRDAPLFQAVFRGEVHAIGRATPGELEPLLGAIEGVVPRDRFAPWNLVSIRWPSGRVDVHALGWRELEGDVWITSPVRTLDQQTSLIRTRSGHVYRLAGMAAREVRSDLLAHLRYALRAWGYVDVVP